MPSVPLVDPIANATICENDNLQLHMLELIKSLQEYIKILNKN